MIKDFDLIFCKITISRNTVNIKKQLLIGFLVLISLIGLFIYNISYAKVCILIFLVFTSILCLIESEIFLEAKDIKIFDIEIGSIDFFKTYISQKIFRDNYVSNIIIVFGFSIFLGIKDMHSLIWFLCIMLAYLIYMPIKHIIGTDCSNMVIILVIIDMMVIASLILGTVKNFKIMNLILLNNFDIYKIAGFILILTCILKVLFTFTNNKKIILKINKIQGKNYYKLISWMKKIDIYLYKDYLINFQHICINIITILVTFLIMNDLMAFKDIYITIIIFIIPSGIFMTKTKGKYNLINDDEFFNNANISNEDLKYIKMKKLQTVLTEVLIKLTISSIVLVIYNDFSIITIVEILTLVIIISIVNYIIILRNTIVSLCYLSVIKYTVVILAVLRHLLNINFFIYCSYLVIVFILSCILVKSILEEEKTNHEKKKCNIK